MPNTSKQTRRKSPADVASSSKVELLPPDNAEPPPAGLKRVTVQRTERFIEPAPAERTETSAAVGEPENEEPEEWIDCPHCEGKFLVSRFEENDGYCPGCGRDEFGDKSAVVEESPRELSEAEMLMQSIADDDAYSLRVEKLTNYDVDPRTDSQAVKEYVTTLKPVTLNYLEIVRAGYGGGAYRFSMYKRGQAGVVKWWVEVIAKPVQPLAAEPSAAQSPIKPTVDKLREAVERAVAKRIDDILDGNINQPAPAVLPATTGQLDEDAIVAKAILNNPEVVSTVIHRVTDRLGSEGDPWYASLVREAVSQLPTILETFQTLLANKPAVSAPPPSGNGQPVNGAAANSQASAPPASPPPTPAEIAFARLLRSCAADMSRSTDARDEAGEPIDVMNEEPAIEETLKLIHNFPEYAPQLERVLSVPPQMLVGFVAQQCQDATLLQNPGSVLFADEYQKRLREVLTPPAAAAPPASEEPAAPSSVVQFPNQPNAEAAQ